MMSRGSVPVGFGSGQSHLGLAPGGHSVYREHLEDGNNRWIG